MYRRVEQVIELSYTPKAVFPTGKGGLLCTRCVIDIKKVHAGDTSRWYLTVPLDVFVFPEASPFLGPLGHKEIYVC